MPAIFAILTYFSGKAVLGLGHENFVKRDRGSLTVAVSCG
jgi:hypothetical protein